MDHARRPSPSPPTPFLSRTAGEEGGDDAPVPFPLAPFLSSTGSGRGNMGGGVKFAHPTRHVQRLAWHARQKERAADGGTERWEPLTQWLARA